MSGAPRAGFFSAYRVSDAVFLRSIRGMTGVGVGSGACSAYSPSIEPVRIAQVIVERPVKLLHFWIVVGDVING